MKCIFYYSLICLSLAASAPLSPDQQATLYRTFVLVLKYVPHSSVLTLFLVSDLQAKYVCFLMFWLFFFSSVLVLV